MALTTSSSPPHVRDTRTWPTVVLELVVVAGLFLAYRSARLLAGHSSAVAFDNAGALLHWERALRMPDELLVQQLLLTSETVTRIANLYYATVHFPLTGAFLIWLFVRSRDHYYRIRTSLALLTGLALAIHTAFPLAPARMLSDHGFVDTAAAYGPAVYDAPEADSLTNQFAAMPSLHFGWAVMIALGGIRVSRSRWRHLWIAHPVITLLVIVGTANHYWTDAAVAGVLILLTEYAVAAWWRVDRQVCLPALGGVADVLPSMHLATQRSGIARGRTVRADWPRASRGPPEGHVRRRTGPSWVRSGSTMKKSAGSACGASGGAVTETRALPGFTLLDEAALRRDMHQSHDLSDSRTQTEAVAAGGFQYP